MAESTNNNDTCKKHTEFSAIGKMAAIDRLFEGTGFTNTPVMLIPGGASAHKIMLEGVDFDLVYNPLKHLGYKSVLNAIGELYAAFYAPVSLSVILGISKRFTYESIAELWHGILSAAKEHNIKSLSLDLVPSVNGLSISVSATGEQKKRILEKRIPPKNMDIICLSNNVGAAFMGQHVLEREKASFLSAPAAKAKQPDLSKYKYILASYLSPELPSNTIERFIEADLVPSSGIFETKGLADSIKRLAKMTGFGAKIYVEKIPIANETMEMAKEINMDVLTAALNGGDDFRLIFTLPIEKHDAFHKEFHDYDVIGHLCKPEAGTLLVTPEGNEVDLMAQGWKK